MYIDCNQDQLLSNGYLQLDLVVATMVLGLGTQYEYMMNTSKF